MGQGLALSTSGLLDGTQVEALEIPGEDAVIGMEGSAIYIPGPVSRNIIIEGTKDPFILIPLLSQVARIFDQANKGARVVEHAYNLCA